MPAELVAELARAASVSQQAWELARPANDFAAMQPHLEKLLELKRRYVDCFPDVEHALRRAARRLRAADEDGRSARDLHRVRDGLVPLVEETTARADAVDDGCMGGPFPGRAQRVLVRRVLQQFGFDDAEWRLDDAAHPFAAALARSDMRLTTRYGPDSIESLFSTMHEFGHGLYERGIDRALERTPLAGGVSIGGARVPEPAVGEHGRAPRPVLAMVLPACSPTSFPRSSWRRSWEDV